MRRFLLASLVTAGLIASPRAALAKTTSDLTGTITDKSSNEPLPGVTVTAASPQLIGGTKSSVTDAKGEFRFSALPPGTYAITATLSGFDTTNSEVRLLLGKDADLGLSMGISGVTAEMSVIAEAPVVEVTSTESKTSIDDEMVENIPILNRDFINLATLVPGVVDDPESTAAAVNVNGARIEDTNFQLDGLNITDASTGTRGANVNLDAIQEIEVITNGFNAEYGRAQGGIINVVTKSGGNDFHASASYYYRSDGLDGVSHDVQFTRDQRAESGDCDAAGTPDCEALVPGQEFDRNQIYLTGEGPIVKDRLWFFATSEILGDEAVVNGVREEWDAGQTQDTDGISVFAKGTAQISSKNTAQVFYNQDPRDIVNSQMGLRSATSYWTSSVTPDREEGGWLLNGKDTHVVNQNLFIEALLGFQKNKVSAMPLDEAGFFGSALYPSDGIYVSRGGLYPFAFSLDRQRLEGKADATFYADWSGAHTFKAGIDLEQLDEQLSNQYAPQLFGMDEATWDNSTQTSVRYPSDNTAPIDMNGDGIIDDDPFTLEIVGYAFAFDTTASNYSVDGLATSFYLQDEWQINSNLTMNIGARLEKEVEIVGVGGNFNFAPRFGLSWDPTGVGKYQVFGNTGLAYDKLFLQSLTYAFSGAVATLYAYDTPLTTADSARWFQFNEFDRNDPEAGSIVSAGTGVPDLARIDPDLKNPYTWYSSIGARAEVLQDLAVGLTFLHREGKDLLQDIEINKRYDPTSPNGLRSIDPNYDNISLLTNVNESDYNGIQFEMNKRFSKSWQLLANYTYSKAEGNGRDYTRAPSPLPNNDGDDPRTFTEEYSVLSYDRTHVVNISGNVNLPYAFQLGWSGSYGTGTPYSKLFTITPNAVADGLYSSDQLRDQVYIGGKNAERLPAISTIDFHLQKNFAVKAFDLQVMADVFNVIDSDTTTKVNQSVQYADFDGDGDREFNDGEGVPENVRFGQPTAHQFGRRFQLGARVRF